jgi:diguanylate cyclase (GGDEF)-like protein
VSDPRAGNSGEFDANRRLALLEQAMAAVAGAQSPAALRTLLRLTGEALGASKVTVEPSGSAAGDDALAVELGPSPRTAARFAVELESGDRYHGRLVAWCDSAVDDSDRETTLAAFARVAAAALDASAVLEQARRDADMSQVLLDLSTALGDVSSVEEVTARLARAVPRLVDCDRAAVVLFAPNGDDGHIEGLVGYDDTNEVFLSSLSFAIPEGQRDQDIAYYDIDSDNKLVRSLMSGTGSVACVSVPITIDGVAVGFVVAAVTHDPARLRAGERKAEQLRALAGQASTAIRNTRLLDQVHHQAMHDALTGLPNRTLILDRAELMLARARRTALAPAVLFLDLDGFKDINDTLGHAVGDQVLCEVADRLTTALRGEDSIGRLGGDEFVVLVEANPLTGDASFVARRLLEALEAPITLPDHGLPLRISASIGIASGHRTSATELLRDADVALYRAKALGRGRYVVFAPSMHVAVRERVELETDLRTAHEERQFFLNYQPVYDLREHRLGGAEALLRWHHPQRGLVPPDTFIPLLEESRLIVDTGRWILEEACTAAAGWHRLGYPIDISVNVSARQLEDEGFVHDVAAVTKKTKLDPASLVLEVTENTLMRDPEMASSRLRELKQIGVKIAVDDFGTGYSSLAHMRRFPVDVLKIDRSFIAAMGRSAEGEALIRTLVQFGKLLGVTTVAEGIEDQLQFARLRREQLDRGQGYLFSQPLGGAAFEAALADASKRGLDYG